MDLSPGRQERQCNKVAKSWRPLTEAEFSRLFEEQYRDLDADERELFDRYRVGTCRATVRRSTESGDETVFVVAKEQDGVLYFDDVEYGFNISTVDASGRILAPGGQNTLKEAVNHGSLYDVQEPKR